jgi:hypothetical protein
MQIFENTLGPRDKFVNQRICVIYLQEVQSKSLKNLMDLVSGLQDGLDENRALISVLKHGALSSSASSLVSTHTLYHCGPIASGAAGVFSLQTKRAAPNSAGFCFKHKYKNPRPAAN